MADEQRLSLAQQKKKSIPTFEGFDMQDVRKAVLHSLSAAPCSLPDILDRTRDINDEVGTSNPASASSVR